MPPDLPSSFRISKQAVAQMDAQCRAVFELASSLDGRQRRQAFGIRAEAIAQRKQRLNAMPWSEGSVTGHEQQQRWLTMWRDCTMEYVESASNQIKGSIPDERCEEGLQRTATVVNDPSASAVTSGTACVQRPKALRARNGTLAHRRSLEQQSLPDTDARQASVRFHLSRFEGAFKPDVVQKSLPLGRPGADTLSGAQSTRSQDHEEMVPIRYQQTPTTKASSTYNVHQMAQGQSSRQPPQATQRQIIGEMHWPDLRCSAPSPGTESGPSIKYHDSTAQTSSPGPFTPRAVKRASVEREAPLRRVKTKFRARRQLRIKHIYRDFTDRIRMSSKSLLPRIRVKRSRRGKAGQGFAAASMARLPGLIAAKGRTSTATSAKQPWRGRQLRIRKIHRSFLRGSSVRRVRASVEANRLISMRGRVNLSRRVGYWINKQRILNRARERNADSVKEDMWEMMSSDDVAESRDGLADINSKVSGMAAREREKLAREVREFAATGRRQ